MFNLRFSNCFPILPQDIFKKRPLNDHGEMIGTDEEKANML